MPQDREGPCAHSHFKSANFMRLSSSVLSTNARKLENTWPDFQNRLGCPEDVFDSPERLVNVSYRLGIVDSVSPQHPEPVVALFGFDLFFIDDKVAASFHF
jgi:hypothetical protein